jgi:RNA polymerase sigma-70 factor (ECF subfamily)
VAFARSRSKPESGRGEPSVARLPSAHSDRGIVAALRAGQSSGGEALYDGHHHYVRRVLTRVLGPDDQVADLVQEVFVTAIDSIGRLEDPDALRPWLASIAVFKARAEIQRRRRQRWFGLFARSEPSLERAPIDPGIGEAAHAAQELMGALGAEERIAFALRHVEGMELAEVAQAMNTSLATAKRRLKRAQERFAALAKDHPSLKAWTGGPS